MRKIIHVDMDCFYAAIEMRDKPSLINKPIAVGGSPDARGVLCTSNYVARQYGVRSAMSSAYAKRLCPGLIILPVAMDKYRQVSQQIQLIFSEYTELVEPLSLDEAYLDVSDSSHLNNSATLIASEIRQRIFEQCQLTASAGIAPNKFLAKVASDMNKPNGQFVITPDKTSQFITSLPVGKIPGVGSVTKEKLEKLGLYLCADLQEKTMDELCGNFGKFGQRLYEVCRGIDHRLVEPTRIRKSLSVENTYHSDLKSLNACIDKLPGLFEDLQKRLEAKEGRKIYKLFVKVKFCDFKSTTVEMTTTQLSIACFNSLISTGYNRRCLPVRLLGLGVGFKKDEASIQHELSFE